MNKAEAKITKILPPIQRARLLAVLLGNGLLRLANFGGGALVAFYLAQEREVYGEQMLAALTAVSSGAELLGAIPFGILADRFSPRRLLVWSAILGAAATQLFGLSGGLVFIFFISRAFEGLSAAAVTPAILAHLADVTAGKRLIRGRIMGLFELSIFAGVALSSLVGSQLWEQYQATAFSLLALLYGAVALLFHWGAHGVQQSSRIVFDNPLDGLKQVWADSRLRRLAPAWLSAMAILALWATFSPYLMVQTQVEGQFLVGRFAPTEVGRIAFFYALTFGAGIVIWGEVLKTVPRLRVMYFGLAGMFGTTFCFYLLNSSGGWSDELRILIIVGCVLLLMVQAGFAPAALAYLVDVAGQKEGRGVAMGIYTVLLALGYIVASVFGGNLIARFHFNGIILGSILLGLICFLSLIFLSWQEQAEAKAALLETSTQ
ncbi:MAG: MFS transporter [Anaerolineae bacterium]|nr:MFS transporter [Anaerolineae bacterium]